jgi:hypothetical protein
VGPDGLGTENGSGGQQRVLLTPTEPVENAVIRQLGIELAQARIDTAFAQGRLANAKAHLMQLLQAEIVTPEQVGTLIALLG